MPAPTVRPARPGETDALLAAYAWLFAAPGSRPAQWDEERARRTIAEIADAEDATLLVADPGDGQIAGFCSVSLDLHSVRFGLRAWVEDLAVDPARRSEGLGKLLLDAAKAWGAERGATHLELDSGDARTDAHRFYEREQPSWTGRQFAWSLA
ncbi:MAG: GNAT family N-acetyltransferase [Solirubrobacterales bacterium]|nr:GNAT family N-acetyltransferase [Solirubrobacterales bacterium]